MRGRSRFPRYVHWIAAVALFGFLLATAGCATLAPSPPATSYDELVAWADRFLAQQTENGRLGVSAAFFRFDGTLLSGGYGLRNRTDELPVTRETVFRVGAISEIVTAYAVMDLVESGVLVLEDPAASDPDEFPLLRLVVEEATGRPFAAHVDSRVLRSVGMVDSTFDPDSVSPVVLATPYSALGRPLTIDAEASAAALYTTADDLALLLEDLLLGYLGSPRQFLDPESYRQMLSPVGRIDEAVSIGLSYYLTTLPDGTTVAHRYGEEGGWTCYYGVNIDSGEGMVLLTNSDAGGRRVIEPVLRAYRRYREGR